VLDMDIILSMDVISDKPAKPVMGEYRAPNEYEHLNYGERPANIVFY
jgi:hypothetical protein